MSERSVDREQVARRVRELEARLDDLYRRLPAHSVPPSMLIELEETEAMLEEARQLLRDIHGVPER